MYVCVVGGGVNNTYSICKSRMSDTAGGIVMKKLSSRDSSARVSGSDPATSPTSWLLSRYLRMEKVARLLQAVGLSTKGAKMILFSNLLLYRE